MKFSPIIFPLILVVVFSCEKTDTTVVTVVIDNPNQEDTIPKNQNVFKIVVGGDEGVSAGEYVVKDISHQMANLETTITRLDPFYVIAEHGHCWSTSYPPTIQDNRTKLGERNSLGTVESSLSNLEPFTKYYVRFYAETADTLAYHPQIDSFVTSAWQIFNTSNLSITENEIKKIIINTANPRTDDLVWFITDSANELYSLNINKGEISTFDNTNVVNFPLIIKDLQIDRETNTLVVLEQDINLTTLLEDKISIYSFESNNWKTLLGLGYHSMRVKDGFIYGYIPTSLSGGSIILESGTFGAYSIKDEFFKDFFCDFFEEPVQINKGEPISINIETGGTLPSLVEKFSGHFQKLSASSFQETSSDCNIYSIDGENGSINDTKFNCIETNNVTNYFNFIETWIGTSKGLIQIESGFIGFGGEPRVKMFQEPEMPSSDILSLITGSIGQDFVSKLFIGTKNGLVIYEEEGFPVNIDWTHFTKENSGLPDNEIRTIAIDFNGTPWVGTDKGLAKWVAD